MMPPARLAAVLLLAFGTSFTIAGCLAPSGSAESISSPGAGSGPTTGGSLGPGGGWCEDVPRALVTALLEGPLARVSSSSAGCEFLGTSPGTTVVITLYLDRGAETLTTIKESGPTTNVDGIGDQGVLATAECDRACIAVSTNTLSVLQGDALVSVSYPGLAERAGALDAAREFAGFALEHLADPASVGSPPAP